MSGRLLIVDGERSWGKKTKERLQAQGYRCYWAQEVDEAMQAAGFVKPAAVVIHALVATDEPWPRLAAALRELAGGAPVIVHGVAAAERAARAGAADAVLGQFDDIDGLVKAIVLALAPVAPGVAPGATRELPVEVVETEPLLVTTELEAAMAAVPAAGRDPAADEGASLAGDLADVPVWELLWQLHTEMATGELRVELAEGAMRLFLENGQPVWVLGGGPANVLGRVMERAGILGPEPHRRAVAELASGRGPSERFGEVLMRQGAVTPQILDRGLALQVEAKLRQLFAARQAPYAFHEGSSVEATRYPQPVVKAILQGLARLPREELLERLHPQRNMFPVVDSSELPRDFPAKNPRVLGLLALLDGSRPLAQMLDGLGDPSFPALVLGLDAMKALRYRMAPAPPPAADDEEPAADGGADDLSEIYLQVKGKTFYEALGVTAAASPEEIAAANDRLIQAVGPAIDGADISHTGRMRVGELRKVARTIKATLEDPGARARYDATLASRPEEDDHRRDGFRVEELLKQAQRQVADEKWEAAHDLFLQAKEASAVENAEVLAGLGYSRYAMASEEGRGVVATEALGLLRRALEIRPQLAMAAFYAGEIERQEGRVDEAVGFYRFGLRHQPDHPRLQRALKLLTPVASVTSRSGPHVVIASDVSCEGADADLEDRLRDLHGHAYLQALHKQFAPILEQAGATFDGDACLFESRGKRLCAMPLAAGDLPPAARAGLLGFPAAFKRALERHILKQVGDGGAKATRIRIAVVSGDGRMEGEGIGRRLTGSLPAQALMALGKDVGAFGTDRATMGQLFATDDAGKLAEHLRPLGLSVTVVPESAGTVNPLYVVGVAAAEPIAAPAEPAKAERPLAALVSKVEWEALQELEGLLTGADERVKALFLRLAEAQQPAAPAAPASMWDRVVRRGRTAPPAPPDVAKAISATAVRLRTRLFEPILRGSKVFLGLADLQQWLRHLEAVGRSYTDALYDEQQAFRKAKKDLWSGAVIDPGYVDIDKLRPENLLAVSEACRFLGGTIDPSESYEDFTFAELTSRAASRVRALLGRGIGSRGGIALSIVDIYDGAIDTPDDSIDPVSFFEYFAVLSLMGVTEGIRAFELAHLEERQRLGTAQHEKAVKDVNDSFDQYVGILRSGLQLYVRINRIFTLRSPFASSNVTKSVFAAKHELPLYGYIEPES